MLGFLTLLVMLIIIIVNFNHCKCFLYIFRKFRSKRLQFEGKSFYLIGLIEIENGYIT